MSAGAILPWRTLLVSLMIIATTPAGSAGTEARPEIEDPRDVSTASADILSVWFETTLRGLRFTVESASMTPTPRSHIYVVGFSIGWDRHSPVVGFDGSGRPMGQLSWSGYGKPDTLLDITFRPGAPGHLSATVPWSSVPDLEPGAELWALRAYTSYFASGMTEWEVEYDNAYSARTYIVGDAGPARGMLLPLTAVAPVLPALTAVVGAVAGAWFSRRKRRPLDPARPSPPDDAVAPTARAAPLPAQPHGIRLDPRKKE